MDLSCSSGAANHLDLGNCDQLQSDESFQAKLPHDLFPGLPSQQEDYLAQWVTYGDFDLSGNDIDISVEDVASSLPAIEQQNAQSIGENSPWAERLSHNDIAIDELNVGFSSICLPGGD